MLKRRLLPLALALGAAAGASAAEPAPEGAVRLEPPTAGRGSALVVDVDPRGSAPSGGETPKSVSVLFQRGFRFEPRAVRGRCGDAQAQEGTCPENSRIGRGSAEGTAGTLAGPVKFTASIDLFLARPRSGGDLADVIVEVKEPQSNMRGSARGSLRALSAGQFGSALSFDVSGEDAQPPAGVTSVEIERVQLRVGAKRSVTYKKKVRGKFVTRRRTLSLVTNPPKCNGTWLIRLSARYADREVQRDARPPCSRP